MDSFLQRLQLLFFLYNLENNRLTTRLQFPRTATRAVRRALIITVTYTTQNMYEQKTEHNKQHSNIET